MSPALISVIVPTYNGASYLAEALASVRAQTYRPLELVVVDDSSNDASPEIAASFRPAVRLAQAHQGAAAARNAGLAAAAGKLIAFLDQDDWWEADKLAQQAAYLSAHPEVEAVITRQRYFVSPGAGTPTWLKPDMLESDQPGSALSTLLARRTLFERLGGFKTDLPVVREEEWFAHARAAGAQIHDLPVMLTHKRVHAGSRAHAAEGPDRTHATTRRG